MTEPADTSEPDPRLLIYAQPQRRVKVASKRRINLHITGEGSPAVILMNGMGGTTLSWARVQRRIETLTTVVAYDHAGLGFSDAGPLPRTSAAIVADLRAALKAAGIAPPYILVGQSASGLHSRLFAFQHPDEVLGVVLVDPSSPHQWDRLFPDAKAATAFARGEATRMREMQALARSGELSPDHPVHGERVGRPDARLPDALNAAIAAKRSGLDEWRTLASEMRAFGGASSDQVVAATRPLGDKPLIVLSAGQMVFPAAGEDSGDALAAWRAMHAEAATLSTRGEMRIVDAGHNMHVEAPHFVVEAITEVLAAVKA